MNRTEIKGYIPMLNDLIRLAGETQLYRVLYSASGYAGYLAAIIFTIWYGRKLGQKTLKIILSMLLVAVCSIYMMQVVLSAETGFARFGQGNIVVSFVFFPFFGYFASKIWKCDWKEMWDYLMCVPLIIHIFARWGCVFMGCCCGYPSEWGIYNIRKEEILFPVQILESAIALIILCVVIFRSHKRHYQPDGMNVPIILISYGGIRIFTEYLHDNTKIVFGWPFMSFHALFMCIVGIIVLITIKRKEKKAISISESC